LDELCTPLSINKRKSLDFLIKAKDVFLCWRESGNAGLSKETFIACIQSFSAIIELTSYLHHQHGFEYILPGKFMSDPIEGRFGWYRQASGGNFFMSVRQLMLTEKKIRILSLLHQDVLFQASRFSSDMPMDSLENANTVEWVVVDDFIDNQLDNLEELSPTDANVNYFVSGYIGRAICRKRKCVGCKELLLAEKENYLALNDHFPADCKHLFQETDRGGLAAPSEFCFAITTIAVQTYTAVSANADIKKSLLTSNNARKIFTTSLLQSAKSRPFFAPLCSQKCVNNHSNFDYIVQCAFNCFSRNELKRINSRKNDPPAKMSRTARKLNSKSTAKESMN